MKYNPFRIHAATVDEMLAELAHRGIFGDQAERLAEWRAGLMIHVENMSEAVAEKVRLDMLSAGAEAVVSGQPGATDKKRLLLLAGPKQLEQALSQLEKRDEELAAVAAEVREALAMPARLRARRELNCGRYTLPLGERTLVMGILNVTPDSFSDGGRFVDLDHALAQARAMVEAGADIIDIGGESTRPGAEPVGEAEELDRVLPVIRRLSAELSVPLSIDTYKAAVAERALDAGAHIINDVWGAKRDPRMAEVAARRGVPIILMHNRTDTDYRDFYSDFVRDLRESVQIALQAGVREEQIILDPGIGFVKTVEQNLETMRRLDDLVALGYPVLLATSRKRMIGHVLDLPVDERVEGTAATVALGVAKGCHMVRVHDVKEMKRVTKMMDAMLKGGI
ncbi:dihydropteroate synthase [Brevibacillus agri]|uniref:dihydropteroate synthase n=1 Tax=Brevibacillus agri TaxID=51101 RepID=UPI0024C02B4E|nr:dihydropteroate synthase [Brevibacillus agri]MED1645344.1 dihydropteroate synthase [Brevibacillus agri]MED1653761.1 dihydropteroate synthase [Brevibacillus agri]MED1689199.1 dihydropteroate synthase [Brevibacillus agri]MED1693393.1 dihydropteroate synthase [Brevibacillus agri]MED1700336.1 dihydropteroate synthase [Brevibacillus agri]